MSNKENAPAVSDLETLIEEKRAVESEKDSLTKKTTELNDRLINPETKPKEKEVLRAEIAILKGQNKLLKQKLSGIEGKIFALQGQDNNEGESNNKPRAKASKPREAKPQIIEPQAPDQTREPETTTTAKPQQAKAPKVERPVQKSGDLEYSINLDEVLSVLNTKRGLRAGKRAEAVTNFEIKPVEEIIDVLKNAGSRKLSSSERETLISILKKFPNNEETNVVHDSVLRILKKEGKLTDADFKEKKPQKEKVEATKETGPSKNPEAPRVTKRVVIEGANEKTKDLETRLLEARHQLENIQKKIVKLRGNIDKAKSVDDYYAIIRAEASNDGALKKERQAEAEKINQIEALENELRKAGGTTKEEVPAETPKKTPEEYSQEPAENVTGAQPY